MAKTIILASPRGFCAGVERAINIVELSLKKYGAPIYVHHEIVHNKFVIEKLKTAGAIFIEDVEQLPPYSRVIYSAHGVSNATKEAVIAKKAILILDATCPLVSKIHVRLKSIQDNHEIKIILIGHRNHPEVEGTMGQIDRKIYLIENLNDVAKLDFPSDTKISIITQTTLSLDDTKEIIIALKNKYPNIDLPKNSDICYATQNRQNAVKDLLGKCDVLFVIGSQNSSNSNRLKELAINMGIDSYLIDSFRDIQKEWLKEDAMVAITAGASAPEYLVTEMIEYLQNLGFIVNNVDHTSEDIIFALPKELR